MYLYPCIYVAIHLSSTRRQRAAWPPNRACCCPSSRCARVAWRVHGVCMACGVACAACAWHSVWRGVCMACAWRVHGVCVACVPRTMNMVRVCIGPPPQRAADYRLVTTHTCSHIIRHQAIHAATFHGVPGFAFEPDASGHGGCFRFEPKCEA